MTLLNNNHSKWRGPTLILIQHDFCDDNLQLRNYQSWPSSTLTFFFYLCYVSLSSHESVRFAGKLLAFLVILTVHPLYGPDLALHLPYRSAWVGCLHLLRRLAAACCGRLQLELELPTCPALDDCRLDWRSYGPLCSWYLFWNLAAVIRFFIRELFDFWRDQFGSFSCSS